MRWGLRTQTFLRIFVALVISISLFPRVAHAEDDEQKYVFPFSKVAVRYPKDHLNYPAVDVEGCYARILAPTAGVISQLHRRDKWTPEKDSPGTRGGLTITLQGDDGVRYFFSNETADAAAINKPHQMPRQPAKGEGVVSVRRTNWKERCGICQSGHHRVPIEHFFKCEWAIHRVQASLVRQQLRNRYVLFPVCSELSLHVHTIEIVISERDFYRHGWELSKTDTVSFGKHFEKNAKWLMRSVVSTYVSFCIPINIAINKFQTRFQLEEEYWPFDSIKKDFFRFKINNGIDFNHYAYEHLEKLILVNMSNAGAITTHIVKNHAKILVPLQ